MMLKLLTPVKIIVEEREVSKIVAEGEHGSFGLLPQHVDFLAAIMPGLLMFVDSAGQDRFVAVDEGVLVKKADEVLVSCRQAIQGTDLDQLEETVREEFIALDDTEREARAASAKLEASFLRNFVVYSEDQR